MAFVRVEQRNAHLAGSVKLEFVNGREGKLAKATLIAISNNARRGSGEGREEEPTAILWTLWGKQAEHAAEYLGKGSHVNIVGRLRNNNHQDNEGSEVYALNFSCEDIDYLDSRAASEARRAKQDGGEAQSEEQSPASAAGRSAARSHRARRAGSDAANHPTAQT
jgi:single-strand DNA-binding protein